MEEVAAIAAQQVVGDVIQEAIDEATGASTRRWALVVIAIAIGVGIAWYVNKRRSEQPAADSAADPSS